MTFKINFYSWKAWERRVAIDKNLRRMRINIVSRCWCYEAKRKETTENLFLIALLTYRLWR